MRISLKSLSTILGLPVLYFLINNLVSFIYVLTLDKTFINKNYIVSENKTYIIFISTFLIILLKMLFSNKRDDFKERFNNSIKNIENKIHLIYFIIIYFIVLIFINYILITFIRSYGDLYSNLKLFYQSALQLILAIFILILK